MNEYKVRLIWSEADDKSGARKRKSAYMVAAKKITSASSKAKKLLREEHPKAHIWVVDTTQTSTKRVGTGPDEAAKLRELAEWICVRKKPVLDALVADIEGELDRASGQKFYRNVTKVIAELALKEVIKSIAVESFIKGSENEANQHIANISNELKHERI